MKRLSYIFTIVLLCLFFVACSDDKEQAQKDEVIVSSELSNHRIMAIAQDSCGYIWLGTYRGLDRYDGNEMHQYYCTEALGSLPDNMIRALHCDHNGRMWVGTKNGVCIYNDKDQFDSVPLPANANNLVMDFAETKRGDMYLLIPDQILRYDTVAGCFTKYIDNISVSGYNGNHLYVDSEDNLWIVDSKSVSCFSTVTKRRLEYIDFTSTPVRASYLHDNLFWLSVQGQGLRVYDIIRHQWIDDNIMTPEIRQTLGTTFVTCISAEPGKKALLLGTNEGLFEFHLDTHRLVHQNQSDFPFENPINDVSYIFFDRNSNVWFGSSTQGFSVCSTGNNAFDAEEYLNRQISQDPVYSLALQNNRLLWIATKHQGIISYDISTHQTHRYPFSELLKFLPDVNSFPYYIMVDSKGQLWISCAPGYVLCLHPEGDSLQKVASYSIPMAIVICEASDHTIWVGAYDNRYFTINPDNGACIEHQFPKGEVSFIANLLVMKDGRLAALTKGMGLSIVNAGKQQLSPQAIPESILSRTLKHGPFIPTSLYQDHNGNLWFGTVSNGVMRYDLSTGELTSFSDAPCEDIASIEEDNKGNIWVGTMNGLGCLNVKTKTFINYYKGGGLNGNEFYDRCSVHLPDDRLIFGGEHGLSVISPKEMQYQTHPCLQLENLRINNSLVIPSDDGPIEKCLSKAKEVVLRYNQNNFSISYSSQNYTQKQHFSYQYRLQGLSNRWVDAKQSHEAFFSNVSPGSYVFSVRIMSQDHQHVLAECSVPVTVRPATLLSWWAKLLYLILIVIGVVYWIRVYRHIRAEKRIRQKMEQDKEQEKRINKMNMSFFANVSHEFRTPLTLISGPVNQLINDKNISSEDRSMLYVVQRSIGRMLRLVNQMMDFHKLEDDALRLEVQQTDITKVLSDIVESFKLQAKDKRLSLTTNGLEEPVMAWVDIDKVEKISYNLLGNAVKYTPAPGRIDVAFDIIGKDEAAADFLLEKGDTVTRFIQIRVSDTGPGIPEDALNKVFERYYQLAKQHNGSFNWGTGIGLYYCRRLVKLHHGYIKVANRTGEVVASTGLPVTGSIFTVLIPLDEEVYSKDVHVSSDVISQQSLYPLVDEEAGASQESGAKGLQDEDRDADKPTLVVVDDDVDIVAYLKLLLQSEYNIIGRYDADSALAAIDEYEPDLIISDVVMPVKNGYTLCREIKNNLQICHLPVILVTAKTTTSDQIEGLDCGAEAYVNKPFDPNYLRKLIASILSNRQKVRQLLSQNTQTDAIDENVLNAQDTAFMNELYSIMEKELSNPEIDINHITDIMHVSRTKLYYKIKGLTGEKPGSFFRLYKLNRAAELIRKGDYTLAEVSDMTGFSSPSYFSTCFKKQFGVSPRDFE